MTNNNINNPLSADGHMIGTAKYRQIAIISPQQEAIVTNTVNIGLSINRGLVLGITKVDGIPVDVYVVMRLDNEQFEITQQVRDHFRKIIRTELHDQNSAEEIRS